MIKVSVIIPAYNQCQYLGEAIQSVLEQSYPEFEAIVVDDGSTDGTAAVAQSFGDVRVRYMYQENRGLSGARNTGMRNSDGEFLSFLDSDDKFTPDKLALLTAELNRHPELGLVAGQAILIDENGRRFGQIFDKPIRNDPRQLLLGNPLHVGSVLVRRASIEKVGWFDETLRSYEDWDMWLRLARAGVGFGWVPQPVSMYRFHRAQMTRIGFQMTTATFAVLDKVFSDAELPSSWSSMREKAYSQANLRAAAQAYLAQDFNTAGENLSKAISLNPELAQGDGQMLAEHFVSWTELPKVADPLAFLEMIYAHLPESASNLSRHRKRHLSQAAMQQAFQAYCQGDYQRTRSAVLHAIRYQPRWVINRGALSILLRSSLR